MEEETNNTEPNQEEKQNAFNTVTPLSRMLALVLFIVLPFVGFWLGYRYAPLKVVEVERVLLKEKPIENDGGKEVYNGRGRTIGTGCFPYEASSQYSSDVRFDPPNTVVKYSNRGIEFDIPYNNEWGSDGCAVKPYKETEEYVSFGVPGAWGPSGIDYVLTFTEAKTSDELLEELENTEWLNNHEKKIINGLEMVTFEQAGMFTSKNYVVIGNEYNYDFSTPEGNEEDLEEILKTVVVK